MPTASILKLEKSGGKPRDVQSVGTPTLYARRFTSPGVRKSHTIVCTPPVSFTCDCTISVCGEYAQSPQALIVQSHVKETGGVKTIVWDLRTPGDVKRRAYNVGVPTDWTSRGLPPDFSSFKI